MISEFHFLRPWWLLTLIPLLGLVSLFWRQRPKLQGWGEVCDPHLLAHLIHKKGQSKRVLFFAWVILSILFMIIGIAGPAWYKFPVATYKPIEPRVVVLDMSENMLISDLTPNRLARAKFKLHDLFSQKGTGQFGMIVFTGEPFVVSPLTEDGQTISSLLSTLTPDIMPVDGQRLDSALKEAARLITDAGFGYGQILVLTADAPSSESIDLVKKLASSGISSSIMPVRSDKDLNPLFQVFASAGQGQLLIYSPDSQDLAQWLDAGNGERQFDLSHDNDIPLWRDEGRWFLIPALICLLPVFRRGWLQRVAV